jgi:hypothetical protein
MDFSPVAELQHYKGICDVLATAAGAAELSGKREV